MKHVVIVTGTRHDIDPDVVHRELNIEYRDSVRMLVVEGGCPVGNGGVDGIAQRWIPTKCEAVEHRQFPPRPDSLRRAFSAACHARNQAMADFGAERMRAGDSVIGLAFPLTDSWGRGGTWDTIYRLVEAGIPVRIVGVERP